MRRPPRPRRPRRTSGAGGGAAGVSVPGGVVGPDAACRRQVRRRWAAGKAEGSCATTAHGHERGRDGRRLTARLTSVTLPSAARRHVRRSASRCGRRQDRGHAVDATASGARPDDRRSIRCRARSASRSQGHVQTYLERGAPLPARRTFTHRTVETSRKRQRERAAVRSSGGELDAAHLCRLVGTLDIGGDAVKDTVPTGSGRRVAIELDRGGGFCRRALVPAIGQVFEQVAHLLVPDAEPEALDSAIRELRRQLMDLRTDAFRHGLGQVIGSIGSKPGQCRAERDIPMRHGGDADAAQRARRALLDVDATMAEADLARGGQARCGSAAGRDRRVVDGGVSTAPMPSARCCRRCSPPWTRRARTRTPPSSSCRCGSRSILSSAAISLPWPARPATSNRRARRDCRANKLVSEGKTAIDRGDTEELRRVVKALWQLLPEDSEARKRGFDSGVR